MINKQIYKNKTSQLIMKRSMSKGVLVEVSARHAHLSQKDIDALFGKGYKLTFLKKLSQPSEFAAKETIAISDKDKRIENVRVVGPARDKSTIEISKTDAYFLKINPKTKIYSDKKDCLITAIGLKGRIKIPAIIKQRHIHMSDKEAKNLGLKNNDKVNVEVTGRRGLIFKNAVVRVSPNYKLAVHIDTDEGNAAGINAETIGKIV